MSPPDDARTLRAPRAATFRQTTRPGPPPGPLAGAAAVLESDGRVARPELSDGRAQPALGAEDEKLFAAKFCRVPSHAGILGEPEDVAARLIQEHLRA